MQKGQVNPPTSKDNLGVYEKVYKRYFGSFPNALRLAGLKIHHETPGKAVCLKCDQCGEEFRRGPAEISKSLKHFCSSSCSATYNNTHKTTGTRKSKLESYLETKLPEIYLNQEFHFNRKDAINSELDIYLPKLKLAFELNGIFHYEAIYGENKLNQIQNNDGRKFQACLEKGIELCIIDTSQLKHFNLPKAQKYLSIICKIIDQKLNLRRSEQASVRGAEVESAEGD